MTTTVRQLEVASLEPKERARFSTAFPIALLALAAAAWSIVARPQRSGAQIAAAAIVIIWSACAFVLGARKSSELGGVLVAAAALAGGVFVAAATQFARARGSSTLFVEAWAISSMPAIGTHILLGLPDGRLRDGGRRAAAIVGYVLALAIAFFLPQHPSHDGTVRVWPVVLLALVLLPAALSLGSARY